MADHPALGSDDYMSETRSLMNHTCVLKFQNWVAQNLFKHQASSSWRCLQYSQSYHSWMHLRGFHKPQRRSAKRSTTWLQNVRTSPKIYRLPWGKLEPQPNTLWEAFKMNFLNLQICFDTASSVSLLSRESQKKKPKSPWFTIFQIALSLSSNVCHMNMISTTDVMMTTTKVPPTRMLGNGIRHSLWIFELDGKGSLFAGLKLLHSIFCIKKLSWTTPKRYQHESSGKSILLVGSLILFAWKSLYVLKRSHSSTLHATTVVP